MQLLAKFEIIMYIGLRATLKFPSDKTNNVLIHDLTQPVQSHIRNLGTKHSQTVIHFGAI